MGRFINADTTDILEVHSDLYDKNLYVYCDNNPVSRIDENGYFWHIALGAAVGVITQYASDVISGMHNGKSFSEAIIPSSTWADYSAAALSGALAATGVGLGTSIVANAALGGTTYLVNCSIKDSDANINDLGLVIGIGACSGMVGGSGANGANLRGIAKTSKIVLRTERSSQKIAAYSAKITTCRKIAIIGGVRTIVAGLVANSLNTRRKEWTRSEV